MAPVPTSDLEHVELSNRQQDNLAQAIIASIHCIQPYQIEGCLTISPNKDGSGTEGVLFSACGSETMVINQQEFRVYDIARALGIEPQNETVLMMSYQGKGKAKQPNTIVVVSNENEATTVKFIDIWNTSKGRVNRKSPTTFEYDSQVAQQVGDFTITVNEVSFTGRSFNTRSAIPSKSISINVTLTPNIEIDPISRQEVRSFAGELINLIPYTEL